MQSGNLTSTRHRCLVPLYLYRNITTNWLPVGNQFGWILQTSCIHWHKLTQTFTSLSQSDCSQFETDCNCLPPGNPCSRLAIDNSHLESEDDAFQPLGDQLFATSAWKLVTKCEKMQCNHQTSCWKGVLLSHYLIFMHWKLQLSLWHVHCILDLIKVPV